ncbi:MAG: iron ABC transporter permease [Chloroflexota bacterium]|nr:iron ABC transporter permease [Chloroflexota bacterium]
MQLARPRTRDRLAPAPEPALVTWRTLLPTYSLAAVATLAVGLFAVSWGTVHIAPQTTAAILIGHLPFVSTGAHSATTDAIIWQVRMPRVLLAGLVGGTLAFSGAAYQGVLRNPLAEPYLIGVASGAAVGATLIIISPLFVVAWIFSPLPPAAFAGALIAVALAYGLARSAGRVGATSLILSGVAVSSMCTSFVTYLMLTYNTRTLAILNWLLGGFNTASWQKIEIGAPYMLIGGALILPFARLLNIMQLDEDDARQLGVDVERVKIIVLALASLATAAAVSVSGLIGFVGLVVPHAVRMIWGSDYRRLLPLSGFFGACFLILADVISRSINPGYELPVGVVTALVGAPFFLYLLRRQQQLSSGQV